MKPVKSIFVLCLVAALLAGGPATSAQQVQALTLEQCYTLARENYPLIKQRDLIAKTRDYSIENAAKGYLPQVNLTGQATYQSDVVSFPGGVPGMLGVPPLSKDQYRVGAELNQVVYDGGSISTSKSNQQLQALIQEQNLEIALHTVKERVTQLYFGILLLNEQLKQNALRQNDIQAGLDKVQAAYANGTALKSSVDELKAELINARQARTELEANRDSFRNMLGLMINQVPTDETILQRPEHITMFSEINRAEVKLYNFQQQTYDLQAQLRKAGNRPRVNLFAQGYYGRPTYNIIDNNFGLFGMVGVRFNWSLTGLYSNSNSRSIEYLGRQNINVQKETFLFNTRLTLTQQSLDALKYAELIRQDTELISLRESVKAAAGAQLEHGVITASDYITKVNAENQARQNLILHQLQLLQAQYNYTNTAGN